MACVHLQHVKVRVTALEVTGSLKAPLFAIFVELVASSATCQELYDSHESSHAVLVMLTKDMNLNILFATPIQGNNPRATFLPSDHNL